MIDELSGHLPGLSSLKLSGIGAHLTMLAAKGKQHGTPGRQPFANISPGNEAIIIRRQMGYTP
jgi:hypothetical protein